jgi:hypothetical protein
MVGDDLDLVANLQPDGGLGEVEETVFLVELDEQGGSVLFEGAVAGAVRDLVGGEGLAAGIEDSAAWC